MLLNKGNGRREEASKGTWLLEAEKKLCTDFLPKESRWNKKERKKETVIKPQEGSFGIHRQGREKGLEMKY